MALIKMHWHFPRQPHLSDANQYKFSKQTPQQSECGQRPGAHFTGEEVKIQTESL